MKPGRAIGERKIMTCAEFQKVLPYIIETGGNAGGGTAPARVPGLFRPGAGLAVHRGAGQAAGADGGPIATSLGRNQGVAGARGNDQASPRSGATSRTEILSVDRRARSDHPDRLRRLPGGARTAAAARRRMWKSRRLPPPDRPHPWRPSRPSRTTSNCCSTWRQSRPASAPGLRKQPEAGERLHRGGEEVGWSRTPTTATRGSR